MSQINRNAQPYTDTPCYTIYKDALAIKIGAVNLLFTNSGVSSIVSGIENLHTLYKDLGDQMITLYNNPLNSYVNAIYIQMDGDSLQVKINTPLGLSTVGYGIEGGYYNAPNMYNPSLAPTFIEAFGRYINVATFDSNVTVTGLDLETSSMEWFSVAKDLLKESYVKTIALGSNLITLNIADGHCVKLTHNGIEYLDHGHRVCLPSITMTIYHDRNLTVQASVNPRTSELILQPAKGRGIRIVSNNNGKWLLRTTDRWGNTTLPEKLISGDFNTFDDMYDSFMPAIKSTEVLDTMAENLVVPLTSLDDLPIDDYDPSSMATDPTTLEWWKDKFKSIDMPDEWISEALSLSKVRGEDAYKVTIKISK